MQSIDLSYNKAIGGLGQLAVALRKSRSALETLHAVRLGLGEAYGPAAVILLSTKGLPKGSYRVLEMVLGGMPLKLTEESIANKTLTVYAGGVIGQIISRHEPQILSEIDWSDDPYFSEELARYGSMMAVPVSGDKLPMDWVLMVRLSPAVFEVSELEESLLRTVLIGSLMESQTLAEQLAGANKRIDREMKEVGRLQRALLPDPLPNVAGLDFAVSYRPSGRAGGDLYDIFPLDQATDSEPARWCILIGDASGHGLAAAVVMAIIHTVLHAMPAPISGPAELLGHANVNLCGKNLGGFVTLFLALYEPATRKLVYSSAGHPAPLHHAAATGALSELDQASSYPIGIDPGETFTEATSSLETGDLLLLYTDGVTESRSPTGEMLDLEPVKQALTSAEKAPVHVIEKLRDRVKQHQQGDLPVDDQTMVVVYGC